MQDRFIFLTRSYDEGFRVLTGSGFRADDKTAKEFDDLLKFSGVKDSAEPCAVMFRHGGNVCVIARSMDTARRDKDTRNILFTFCVETDRDSALKIFSRLVNNWDSAEESMRLCLDDKQNRITFAHEKFTSFLKSYPLDTALKVPAKNVIARCVKGSAPQNVPAVVETRRRLKGGLTLAGMYLAVIAVVVAVTMTFRDKTNTERVQQIMTGAANYASLAGEKVSAAVREFEDLSGDIAAGKQHITVSGDINSLREILKAYDDAEESMPALKADLAEAPNSLELSRTRINAITNAETDEAEQLAKFSGEAADRAAELSESVRKKITGLREKLSL